MSDRAGLKQVLMTAALGVAMVIVAGCSSSLGLRGHTQSVSGIGAHYGDAQRRSPPRDARPRTVEPLETGPRYAPQPTYGEGGYAAAAPIERGSIDAPTFESRTPPGNRSGGVAYHQDGYGSAAGEAEDEASGRIARRAGRRPALPERGRGSPSGTIAERDWRDEGSQRLAAAELEQAGAVQPPVTREPARPPGSSSEAARPAVPDYEKTGWALWTGEWWRGGPTTAIGEAFDNDRLTGAHASLPLPSYLYVTNRANGRTILVRVNDRIAPEQGRVVVVSRIAAELLGFRAAGRAQVDIQYAGPAGQRPSGRHEMAFVEKQSWFHPGLLPAPASAPAALAAATAPGSPDGRRGSDYPRSPDYPRWDGSRR